MLSISSVNIEFKTSYLKMFLLKVKVVKQELVIDAIDEVEQFFLNRKRCIQDFVFPRYDSCFKFVLGFWSSTDYFSGTMISRGKKNIFLVLKKEFLSKDGFEISLVLKKMESSWLAFSQCYRRQYIHDVRLNNDELGNLVESNQLSTVHLLQALEVIDWDLKEEMDRRLEVGFKQLLMLQKNFNERRLKIEEVTEVESYFKKNGFELNDLIVSKYYSRYVKRIYRFWNVCLSKEEGITLFDNMKEGSSVEDINTRFLAILNEMEELWVACDHIYTMYQIRTIRRQYML
ncbi:hypothetical protein ACKLNQ_17240 [Myroides odoratimimus]|uniref:hypothetical protein n=1 Tax=Myroides odoratimimus TaxID=76832 RepID=UPI0038D50576